MQDNFAQQIEKLKEEMLHDRKADGSYSNHVVDHYMEKIAALSLLEGQRQQHEKEGLTATRLHREGWQSAIAYFKDQAKRTNSLSITLEQMDSMTLQDVSASLSPGEEEK